MEICKICQTEIKNNQILSSHIKIHNISSEDYYKKYINPLDNVGICLLCKKNKTKYNGLSKGYQPFCSDPKCRYGVTKEKFILKWGQEKGNIAWNTYRNKQKITNEYEYKKEKYGWSKDDFNKFNQSRAITLDNMIKKYGEEEGNVVWNKYVNKQKYVGCCLDYYIEKYGEVNGLHKWKELNKSKSNTISNYIRRYGEEIGKIKYEEFINKKMLLIKYYSNISQELFDKLDIYINHESYYATKNKEYGKMDCQNNCYYFVDYCVPQIKKIIEFNGINFHVKYPDNEKYIKKWKNPFSNISAENQILKDQNKKNFFNDLGFEIYYIWEDDYNLNKKKEIEKCKNFLMDI